MHGLRVGHQTLAAHGTGVTAFIFDKPAVGAYLLCGSSPASHELALLDLDAQVTHINGLVFAGGSAFGLAAVMGAMRWFAEQQIGWPMPQDVVVPLIPAAAIYDLSIQSSIAPTAEDGYLACQAACENNVTTGRVGAGTGASVGKTVMAANCMSGGVGFAKLTVGNVNIEAYAVVNCVGDVRNLAQEIVAGARWDNGQFADCETQLLADPFANSVTAGANSTLVVVFTDAAFSKNALKRIAKMALAGMARAITPIFTLYDGDIIFCLSVGTKPAAEIVIGTAAARAVQAAIVNAVEGSIVLAKG